MVRHPAACLALPVLCLRTCLYHATGTPAEGNVFLPALVSAGLAAKEAGPPALPFAPDQLGQLAGMGAFPGMAGAAGLGMNPDDVMGGGNL